MRDFPRSSKLCLGIAAIRHLTYLATITRQAGVLAPGGEELLDPLLLPELLDPPDELDREAGLPRERFGVGPHLLAERLSPPGVVEEPDVPGP